MPHPHSGRHEYGQNFLRDRGDIAAIVLAIERTDGPIVEIGAGDGALTCALQDLGRPLTAIEIDASRATRLAQRTKRGTRVVQADFLKYPLPHARHVIVGNLPFHLTTAMLRRILHGPGWTNAVLLLAVVRIRFGAKGIRVVVSASAQRRRWTHDDQPAR